MARLTTDHEPPIQALTSSVLGVNGLKQTIPVMTLAPTAGTTYTAADLGRVEPDDQCADGDAGGFDL